MFINSDLISPRDPDFFHQNGCTTVNRGKEGGNFFNCNICTNQRSLLILPIRVFDDL